LAMSVAMAIVGLVAGRKAQIALDHLPTLT
jgi:hypothetical protein